MWLFWRLNQSYLFLQTKVWFLWFLRKLLLLRLWFYLLLFHPFLWTYHCEVYSWRLNLRFFILFSNLSWSYGEGERSWTRIYLLLGKLNFGYWFWLNSSEVQIGCTVDSLDGRAVSNELSEGFAVLTLCISQSHFSLTFHIEI